MSFTVPPATAAELRKIPAFETFDERKGVLRCTKPGTGLRDAPTCFSLKLRRVTVDEAGFIPFALEGELEVLYEDRNGSRVLTCILVNHVDDLKIAGEPAQVQRLLQALERTFGKLERETGSFVHCGIRHVQDPTTKEVSLDQMDFLNAIKEMPYPAIKGAPSEELLDERMSSHFLSLLMTVAFALQTRPDAAVFVTALQRACHKATVLNARQLNAVLRWLQRTPKKLWFRRLPEYPGSLVLLADSASKAAKDTGLSVRGMLALRCTKADLGMRGRSGTKTEDCIETGTVHGHLIEWVSKTSAM